MRLALALLLCWGCRSEKKTVVVASLISVPARPDVTTVSLTLGAISKSFATPGGLHDREVIQLGLYIDKATSGMLTLRATANGTNARCATLAGESTVDVPAGHSGAVLNAAITLRETCGGGDGGALPGPDAAPDGGAPGTDGPRPDAAADAPRDTAVPADAPADRPPDVGILPPPDLTSCVEYEHAAPRGMCDELTNLNFYSLFSVGFSPDNETAFTAGSDGRVRLWKINGATFTSAGTIINSMLQARAAFSPDGKLLAVGGNGGDLFLYEIATRATIPLPGHMDRIRGVSFTADGAVLVTLDRAGVVGVWDVAMRRALTLRPLFVGVAEAWSLSIARRSTNPLWAAVGLARATGMPTDGGVAVPDDGAYVWFGNLASPGQASLLRSNTDSVNATAISPDERLLVAGGDGAEPANVWDITTRAQPTRIAMIAPSRDADINANRDLGALDFGADSRYVGAVYGSGGSGGVVRVIDATTGMVMREHYKKLAYYPVSVAMRPTGGMMVVGEVGCGLFAVCSN